MKEMSKEEFYEKIRSVIRGEISTTKLVKELQTDSRTLNNKIQELSPKILRSYVIILYQNMQNFKNLKEI